MAARIDASNYLDALDEGQTALTSNRRDFDRMQQIVPDGRVLFHTPS